MLFKPIGTKEAFTRCLEGIWVAIIGEIWIHRNKGIFKNWRMDLLEVFTVVQRKTWSLFTAKERLVDFSSRIGVWTLCVV